jgi:MoaA/NifB/PqqE/SkfB family radical SAM enzyme
MSLDESLDMIRYFHGLGTRAITISGGGEPLLWKHLEKFLTCCSILNIKIGITTSFFNNEKLAPMLNEYVTWLRLSVTYNGVDFYKIVRDMPNTDLGISWVINRHLELSYLDYIIELSEINNNVTHVRLVNDLVDKSDWGMTCDLIKRYRNSKKVMIHYKDVYNSDNSTCYLSKLKPLISADGFVYPCCGTQYAKLSYDKDLTDEFKMCHWKEFDKTDYFNGIVCERCYYNSYNVVLRELFSEVKHPEFI